MTVSRAPTPCPTIDAPRWRLLCALSAATALFFLSQPLNAQPSGPSGDPSAPAITTEPQRDPLLPRPVAPSAAGTMVAPAVSPPLASSPGEAPLGAPARSAAATAQTTTPPAPLDITEPPFAFGDFTWLNGNNRQPDSLLKLGPITFGMIVDAYYLFQFNRPIDHTAFPSTTAARHNELSLNMVGFGAELPPNAIDSKVGSPVGQFNLQYGATSEATMGQDSTFSRGSYLSRTAYQPIRTAQAGWHFHFLHGVNVEFGIFPSYVAMESYLPEENWNYLHPFVSEFTPYYFSGSRTQLYLTQRLKLELWVVNGWQTFGQWQEGRAGGFLWNWRPSERFSLSSTVYAGQEAPLDSKASRWYTDNYAQYQYYKSSGSIIRSGALAVVGDLGYDYRSWPARDGLRTGGSFSHRLEFQGNLAWTLRGDIYYDHSQAVVTAFPISSFFTRPFQDQEFLGGGLTTTFDYWPSPWTLFRLEYVHREASIPFFSGHGGITGPAGIQPASPAGAVGFVPDLKRSDDRVVVNVTLRL